MAVCASSTGSMVRVHPQNKTSGSHRDPCLGPYSLQWGCWYWSCTTVSETASWGNQFSQGHLWSIPNLGQPTCLAQAVLEQDPPASASWVLGLQAYVSVPTHQALLQNPHNLPLCSSAFLNHWVLTTPTDQLISDPIFFSSLLSSAPCPSFAEGLRSPEAQKSYVLPHMRTLDQGQTRKGIGLWLHDKESAHKGGVRIGR
jgi:hypothetical protein